MQTGTRREKGELSGGPVGVPEGPGQSLLVLAWPVRTRRLKNACRSRAGKPSNGNRSLPGIAVVHTKKRGWVFSRACFLVG